MFLELWMCGVLAATFGFCAWWNRQNGIALGTIATLQRLIDEKVVSIEEDKIVPYRNSWAPKLAKRRSKK
jgi:hypothetical protein